MSGGEFLVCTLIIGVSSEGEGGFLWCRCGGVIGGFIESNLSSSL